MKKVTIKIEIPEDWLDESKLSNLSFITLTCRQVLQEMLLDYGFNEAMKTIKFPEIKIDKKELKERILDKMVEDKLENI